MFNPEKHITPLKEFNIWLDVEKLSDDKLKFIYHQIHGGPAYGIFYNDKFCYDNINVSPRGIILECAKRFIKLLSDKD
jgi:hypothetical protein